MQQAGHGTTAKGQDGHLKPPFEPEDLSTGPAQISLPHESWISVISNSCSFPSRIFEEVMLNLVKNPNLNSSHLFRADIFYDSVNDASFQGSFGSHNTENIEVNHVSDFVQHMKEEYRPWMLSVPGYKLERTIVRQMIPRNPQLDKSLVQTCHFYTEESGEKHLVIYVPHANTAEQVPWYHPKVRKLAFLHTWESVQDMGKEPSPFKGRISVHIEQFPPTPSDEKQQPSSTILPDRLQRTCLNLLQTVFKHGQGKLEGYVKRVHHDQIVPQKAFQDRYTGLKRKYAKTIIDGWVEQTEPSKHVFEDLGIAAFLMTMWDDTYDSGTDKGHADKNTNSQAAFPGFVDIGCGNGLLVYILNSEGYPGWGFDARSRKTWSTFPENIQARLKTHLLVPKTYQGAVLVSVEGPGTSEQLIEQDPAAPSFHDGVFAPGTLIISNHADELTAWTPLLAYLNGSPFIAIPCCSHNLAGARFRARAGPPKGQPPPPEADRSSDASGDLKALRRSRLGEAGADAGDGGTPQVKGSPKQGKPPSAYASLCSYVSWLAGEVGYVVEKDVLRIPSTRNVAIIGRRTASTDDIIHDTMSANETRTDTVRGILERELGASIENMAAEWIKRAEMIAKTKGTCH